MNKNKNARTFFERFLAGEFREYYGVVVFSAIVSMVPRMIFSSGQDTWQITATGVSFGRESFCITESISAVERNRTIVVPKADSSAIWSFPSVAPAERVIITDSETPRGVYSVRRAAAAPKTAVICPCCGATTMPDANGCCEYCGGALNG